LDNISLMALTISVGFVVDDAIVMIENIVRYLEQGDRPFEAALKGAGQIGFTIISITFSLIAVFIPLLFMSVIIGRLFREFEDTGFIFGQAEGRQDISFYKMSGLVHQVVDIVQKDPAVSGIFYFAGAYAYNPTENTGRVFLQLKPHDERNVTSDQVIQRLRPKVAAVQGLKF